MAVEKLSAKPSLTISSPWQDQPSATTLQKKPRAGIHLSFLYLCRPAAHACIPAHREAALGIEFNTSPRCWEMFFPPVETLDKQTARECWWTVPFRRYLNILF